MKLRVFASLAEDINNGWVWLPESVTPKRVVVQVRNLGNRRSVYCEALPIGTNFITRYNHAGNTIAIENSGSCIVLNEWYREKLGIQSTQIEHDFEITTADNPYGHFRASLSHPQIVVRLAMELAIVGLVLGIIGLCR
jgi:hypothetical protein